MMGGACLAVRPSAHATIPNAAFSDTRFEIVEQIAEGEAVASHVILRSLHSKAGYQGVPPTGKRVEAGAVTIERVKGGEIVERRVYSDRLAILRQLGLLPHA